MGQKIALSADSTCDLTEELIEENDVHRMFFHITVDGEEYIDSQTITAKDIERIYIEKKVLPKTAAANVSDYLTFFSELKEQYDEVIHINLSSGFSSTYQNAVLASRELEGVYCVDSHNLSSGCGLLVLKAADMIKEGLGAKEIAEKLNELRMNVHTSFILSDLSFLAAGGRCSAAAAFGANLLKIKPCIEVHQDRGVMDVGNKYRGDFTSCAIKYIHDQLDKYDNIDYSRLFFTSTTLEAKTEEAVLNELKSMGLFENIYRASASCSITSHCGPNCMGILFMTK